MNSTHTRVAPAAAAGQTPQPPAHALTMDEWTLAADLMSRGLNAQGVLKLVRLRAVYRRLRAPALDGFKPDGNALFARWLVATGRLSDCG